MHLLFIFAHPDDEVVACGGTVRLLTTAGHQCDLVMVTNGNAGEVASEAQARLNRVGSKQELRAAELERSAMLLGYNRVIQLNYEDGEITNKQTWGQMTEELVRLLNGLRPEVVVTFDHTGWYYHLDHIATSIAATRATRQAKHQTRAILYNWFRPAGIEEKWPYCYGPMQHNYRLNIQPVIREKVKAIRAHGSQKLEHLVDLLEGGQLNYEYFQVVTSDEQFRSILKESGFENV